MAFLVIELTWKLFCQTGNIETYLLLKELEEDQNNKTYEQSSIEEEQLDTNM